MWKNNYVNVNEYVNLNEYVNMNEYVNVNEYEYVIWVNSKHAHGKHWYRLKLLYTYIHGESKYKCTH